MSLWSFFRAPKPPRAPDFPAAANIAPAQERRRRIDDAWHRLADHERRIRALEALAEQEVAALKGERDAR